MGSPYDQAVQERLDDKENQTGHRQPLHRIAAEMSEELVDVRGWSVPFDEADLLPYQQELLDRVLDRAREAWYDCERLRDSLE